MGNKTFNKKYIAVISVVVGIIGIIIYGTLLSGNAKDNDEDVLLREYPVTRGDITAGTDGSGSLALNGIPQNFDGAVKLEEVYVKQGDQIKKGDVIARASQKDLEQKLNDLNIELSKAKIALENARNAKRSGVLDPGTSGAVGGVQAEYDLQKTQVQTEVNEVSANIAIIEARIGAIDVRIAEIDTLLAALPAPTDISSLEEERIALIEEEAAKEIELVTEYSKLNTAKKTIEQIENTKNQKLNEIALQNVINQQKKSIEAEDLTNGIALAQIDVDEINKKIMQVEQLLRNLELTADCGGLVLEVNYSVGSETIEEKPVVSIGDVQDVYVRLQVGQADIVDVIDGQDVELSFDAFPERTFTGKVTSKTLIPIKDSNPVMYQVSVSVNKEEFELLPGMTCNAQFIIKQAKDVLVLSNKAIKVVGGKQVVLLKDERGKLYEQEIETGFSDGKFSEVLSGLNKDQIVYVEG